MSLLNDHRRTIRIGIVLLAFLAVFVALDWWTHNFQIFPGVVTWYPPDGLAFALLLTLGPEFAPLLIVGSFISSSYIYQFSAPLLDLLVWAILLGLVYGLAAWFLRRIRFDPQLRSTRDILWLIFIESGVSMILATVSTSASVGTGIIPQSERFAALSGWWLGEMTGVLAITPALLIHVMPVARRWIDGGFHFDRQSIVPPSRKVIGQILALLATLILIFNMKWPGDLQPIFLVALPLIWIALQFGLSGIGPAIGVVNFGIMMTPWIFRISPTHLVSLQVQLLIVSVAALINGSIITENRKANSTSVYRSTSEILGRQKQVARELSVILVSAIAVWIIEYNFDLYGSLRGWELRMGIKWLDETLVTATFLGLAFALFSYRRWTEVRAEIQVRQKAETELQQLNLELEHANRAKDEFLANMSHELRTPLNGILGMSEILLEQRRDPLSDYQNRSIQMIESSGQHLLVLINDILDLSKIESGKTDFHPEIVDIAELSRSSLAFVKGQAIKKSISLTYEGLQPHTKIYGDPRRLKQILINLLINAVKFTPEGGQVTLRVRSYAEEDLIQFFVIDNGIGIAVEDIERLFQPFVQVDSSLNRQYEGTGLGLALVQKLTDLHGGSINVESELGRGSNFTINLPWGWDIIAQLESSELTAKVSAIQVVEKEQNETEKFPRRAVILLAEDNTTSILTIGDYLESHDFEVEVAHNGFEAIQKAEARKPDIILMDIQMPGMDGLEAIRRLRTSPDFGSTPIIALTALAMPGDRERCLAAGADDYISKPVNLKRLLQRIREMQ